MDDVRNMGHGCVQGGGIVKGAFHHLNRGINLCSERVVRHHETPDGNVLLQELFRQMGTYPARDAGDEDAGAVVGHCLGF